MTDTTETAPAASRPGMKTSEFRGKSFLQILMILNMMPATPVVPVSPEVTATLVAGVEGAYAIGRSLVKAFGRG